MGTDCYRGKLFWSKISFRKIIFDDFLNLVVFEQNLGEMVSRTLSILRLLSEGFTVDIAELESLCSCVDNVAEFRLQRRAADQETVDIFFFGQLFTIFAIDRAAVEDLNFICDIR